MKLCFSFLVANNFSAQAIPKIDPQNRATDKAKRLEVEHEFIENQSRWYDKNGEVYPLQKISDSHFVALPEDQVVRGEN